jgi:hypothetical protein
MFQNVKKAYLNVFLRAQQVAMLFPENKPGLLFEKTQYIARAPQEYSNGTYGIL